MALKVDNKIFLSWDDLNSLVENLCKKIVESELNIKSITGIERRKGEKTRRSKEKEGAGGV